MIWALPGAALALAGMVLAFLRRRYVCVLVEGDSMEPTLRSGQRVLVRRLRADRVRRGQMVVLAYPPGSPAELDNPPWLVKRVVAVPGDPVPHEVVPSLRDMAETHVPHGRLVLFGDNGTGGYDSRRVGYFAADTVLGVVVRVLANSVDNN